MRFLLALLLLIPSLAFAQPLAIIHAPDEVNVGDLVIIDGGQSIGVNHLWVIDERAQGRFLEIPADRRVVFAIGTPGKYSFQLIVADTSAGISQAIHYVQVGGVTLPPIVSPPTPQPPVVEPEPEPEPPAPPTVPENDIAETSRRGAVALADWETATALRFALEAVVENPPTTIDRQRSAVQDAIAGVLLTRHGVSREKDWLNEWRIPVNAAIDKVVTDETYIAMIEQVIRGLDALQESPNKPIDNPKVSSIKMFTRDDCKYCRKWKASEMPRLKAQGWKVSEVTDDHNAVPYYDICIDGRCVRHHGYLTMAQLKAYVESE